MSATELAELKGTLRALVVSSPRAMDVRTLLNDYRSMEGCELPFRQFGYTDAVRFLRAQCADCFLFQGAESNPYLTLIVPKQLQHIDAFVQKQRAPSSNRTSRLLQKQRREKNVNETKAHSGHGAHLPQCGQRHTPRADDVPAPPAAHQSPLAAFMRRRLSAAALDDGDQSTSSAFRSQLSGDAQSALEAARDDVLELVEAGGRALSCRELPAAYRARHHTDLDVQRFGYSGIATFALSLVKNRPQLRAHTAADGELVLLPRDVSPPPPRRAAPVRRSGLLFAPLEVAHEDEALPGIPFDPDVFPADCVQPAQCVAPTGVQWALCGGAREMRVGEVYSPSHLWVQLLGNDHHIAMEKMIEDMTEYYSRGEGRQRALSHAATRRPGHYCAALFEGEWHRAVVVTPPDSARRLKVRHVDYGTVDTVPTASLKPLLRQWATLPAQAVRARLGGVRPVAGARRWVTAASTAFLNLVKDKHFVACIVSVDTQESIVEVLLVDTSTETDVRVDEQLVRAGHAEPHGATMAAGGVHLLPTFRAIEDALTPNYSEIHTYLRDGINLDCVPEFHQHVPSLLPPSTRPNYAPSFPAPPRVALSPRATPLYNRVPLTVSRSPPGLPPAAPLDMSALHAVLPAPGEMGAGVTLTAKECQMYRMLLQVDPYAAQCYMLEAVNRVARHAAPPSPLAPLPATSHRYYGCLPPSSPDSYLL